jgi:hypothetical protein
MARKLFCSMFVMVVAISFVAADEFQATITKVDGDNVTYQKYKKANKKKEKDGDAVTASAKGAKVISGKADPDNAKKVVDGDEIKDGLKNEMFTKIDEKKGVNATITTEGDKITKIRVFVKKKAAAE